MDDQDVLLLIKYLNNQCNRHELSRVTELLTNPIHTERLPDLLEEASRKFEGQFETSPAHQKKSWSKISASLARRSKVADKRVWSGANRLKIAAAVIILLGVGLLIQLYPGGIQYPSQADSAVIPLKTVSNQPGEKSRLTLPDGTVVIMNSATSVTYPVKFTGELRSVTLKGEAYFDVAENSRRPFIVNAKGIKTTVLGTTFNIRAYDYLDQVKVSLTSGKIDIQLPATPGELILDPGQELVYDAGASAYKVETFESNEVLDWQNGVLRFDGASEEEVLKMLEHWYNVTITVVNSTANTWENLNARYDNESLENVLISLGYTLNFDHEINGSDIKIFYK